MSDEAREETGGPTHSSLIAGPRAGRGRAGRRRDVSQLDSHPSVPRLLEEVQ
jgi:hypothetical protein